MGDCWKTNSIQYTMLALAKKIYSATLVKCIEEEDIEGLFKSWMIPLKATVLEINIWHTILFS